MSVFFFRGRDFFCFLLFDYVWDFGIDVRCLLSSSGGIECECILFWCLNGEKFFYVLFFLWFILNSNMGGVLLNIFFIFVMVLFLCDFFLVGCKSFYYCVLFYLYYDYEYY